MTEIPTCPTCGRVPSAACWGEVYYYEIDEAEVKHTRCPDPIHDLADQGPALKAECDEARAEVEHQKLRGDRLAERVDRVMAERDEARKRLQDTREELFTEREDTARCVATIARLAAERDEAHALVFDLFKINCSRGGYIQDFFVQQVPTKYDHAGMATYEDAQAALIAWGMVKREECVRP